MGLFRLDVIVSWCIVYVLDRELGTAFSGLTGYPPLPCLESLARSECT